MKVSFELTMPSVASWDGKWTGEGRKYFIIKSFRAGQAKQVKNMLKDGPENFYYRWEDGWAANVRMKLVDSKEAAKLAKASSGFCGYDWMVESILRHGKIQTI